MTMVNSLTLGHAGYMIASTGTYNSGLQLVGFGEGPRVLSRQRMVLGMRGWSQAGNRLSAAIAAHFQDFDSFVSDAERFLRMFDNDLHPFINETLRLPGSDGGFQIDILGYSAKRRSVKLWKALIDGGRGAAGNQPLSIDICHESVLGIAPGVGSERLHYHGLFGDQGFVADPEGCLLHLAELQRWESARINGSTRYYVGGQAVLAKVDRHGISTRIVKDWGDKAGALILPKQLTPPPRVSKVAEEAESHMSMAA